ncbi:MAG: FmdE family protein [Desulfococcaceae bacterium]
MRKYSIGIMVWVMAVSLLSGFFSITNALDSDSQNTEYEYWSSAGKKAGDQAFAMMKQNGIAPKKENLIVLSNAGYAEIGNSSTMGFIDGISDATGCRRGNNAFAEIHSRYDAPLWCAVYDKVSGLCAYLQLKSSKISGDIQAAPASEIFEIAVSEKINADHLYANAEAYNKKFSEKIFGGNDFRIVSIANALAKGVPSYVLRAFEYHDHYCPGVTSGIMMVNYLKKNFPVKPGSSYFVQSVQPWCKEDALMTLLNATPGKGGYSALYSTEADREKWKPEAKDAATIVYREDKGTKKWDGIVLGFKWDDSVCKEFGKSMIGKLCMDLHYLDRLDKPEDFVREIKRFELPAEQTPKDWARPGIDPMKMLDLTVSSEK